MKEPPKKTASDPQAETVEIDQTGYGEGLPPRIYQIITGDEEDTHLSVTPECPGRYLAPFDLDSAEIGRGGMGRILALQDGHVGREVALKELRHRFDDEVPIEEPDEVRIRRETRFLREARITGQLIHPNIVPVYEVGSREDGSLYYTMRLVKGRTLKEALRSCSSLNERLNLLSHFEDLCNAVAYAHSKGVIHRDLKPENVMLGEFGETLVLDWGLAKILGRREYDDHPESAQAGASDLSSLSTESSAALTVDGSFMGTPAYVSPEQAMGSLSEIDTHADVWSLGAILHEILTGSPPFTGKSAQEVLVRVLTEEVENPCIKAPEAPADLCSVCAKALSREKEHRYESAEVLSKEVASFRSGARVLAHEYTSLEHLRRFASQNKALLFAVAAVFAVVVVALVAVTASYSQEKTAKEEAQEAMSLAKAAEREERLSRLKASYHFAQGAAQKAKNLMAQRQTLFSSIYSAASLARNPAFWGSDLYEKEFAEQNPQAQDLALRSFSRLYQAGADSFVTHVETASLDTKLNRAVLSPNGNLTAFAGRDGQVLIFETGETTPLHSLRIHKQDVNAVAFSPVGDKLVSADEQGTVALIDVSKGSLLQQKELPCGAIYDLAWSPDGISIAAGCDDGSVLFLSSDKLHAVQRLKSHLGPVLGVQFSKDSSRLASGSRDGTAIIHDPSSHKIIATFRGHDSVVSKVSFSPSGRYLATSGYDKTARVWDIGSKKEIAVLEGHGDEVMDVDFASSDELLITASWDRTIMLWDPLKGALLNRFSPGDAPLLFSDYNAETNRILTTDNTGKLALWQLGSHLPVYTRPGQEYTWTASFSPDGERLVVGDQNGAIRIWSTAQGVWERTLREHKDLVQSIDFLGTETFLSGGYDSDIRVWNADTGELLHRLKEHKSTVRIIAASPSATLFASGSRDGRFVVWDAREMTPVKRVDLDSGLQARAASFSPSEQLLALGGDKGVLKIYSLPSFEEKGGFDPATGSIYSLAFSPNDQHLAASAAGGKVYVWNVATGKLDFILEHGESIFYKLAFTPDGAALAASCDNKTTVIWSLLTREPFLIFEADQSVTALDISPDGKVLVFGDGNTLRSYPMHSSPKIIPAIDLQKVQRTAGWTLSGFNLEPGGHE